MTTAAGEFAVLTPQEKAQCTAYVPEWVFDVDLSPLAFKVFIKLMTLPLGLLGVAEKLVYKLHVKMSVRSAQRALKELKGEGLIYEDRRTGKPVIRVNRAECMKRAAQYAAAEDRAYNEDLLTAAQTHVNTPILSENEDVVKQWNGLETKKVADCNLNAYQGQIYARAAGSDFVPSAVQCKNGAGGLSVNLASAGGPENLARTGDKFASPGAKMARTGDKFAPIDINKNKLDSNVYSKGGKAPTCAGAPEGKNTQDQNIQNPSDDGWELVLIDEVDLCTGLPVVRDEPLNDPITAAASSAPVQTAPAQQPPAASMTTPQSGCITEIDVFNAVSSYEAELKLSVREIGCFAGEIYAHYAAGWRNWMRGSVRITKDELPKVCRDFIMQRFISSKDWRAPTQQASRTKTAAVPIAAAQPKLQASQQMQAMSQKTQQTSQQMQAMSQQTQQTSQSAPPLQDKAGAQDAGMVAIFAVPANLRALWQQGPEGRELLDWYGLTERAAALFGGSEAL